MSEQKAESFELFTRSPEFGTRHVVLRTRNSEKLTRVFEFRTRNSGLRTRTLPSSSPQERPVNEARSTATASVKFVRGSVSRGGLFIMSEKTRRSPEALK